MVSLLRQTCSFQLITASLSFRPTTFPSEAIMPTIRSIAFALSAMATQLASAKDWDSPAYKWLYEYPMPIAPVKIPKETFQFPNGPNIEYYEIDIKPFEQQVYPNLGKTKLVGYDGSK